MKHRLLQNRDDIKLQFLNASMHAGLGRAALGSSEPSADQLTATHAMKIHAEARHLVTHGQSSAIAHRKPVASTACLTPSGADDRTGHRRHMSGNEGSLIMTYTHGGERYHSEPTAEPPHQRTRAAMWGTPCAAATADSVTR